MDHWSQHPLLKNENKALSFRAKIFYNSFFEMFHYFKNNISASIPFTKRKIELIENQPGIWKNRPVIYLNALNNLPIPNPALYQNNSYQQQNQTPKLRKDQTLNTGGDIFLMKQKKS